MTVRNFFVGKWECSPGVQGNPKDTFDVLPTADRHIVEIRYRVGGAGTPIIIFAMTAYNCLYFTVPLSETTRAHMMGMVTRHFLDDDVEPSPAGGVISHRGYTRVQGRVMLSLGADITATHALGSPVLPAVSTDPLLIEKLVRTRDDGDWVATRPPST